MNGHFHRSHLPKPKSEPPPPPEIPKLDPSAPFPAYPRKTVEEVLSTIQECGHDPYDALGYEISHENRDVFIEALERLANPKE